MIISSNVDKLQACYTSAFVNALIIDAIHEIGKINIVIMFKVRISGC